MKIGMLWFDNDPNKTFEAKVKGAVHFYYRKYALGANLCVVHPNQPGIVETVEGVNIRTNRSVLPNHFWVGVDTP